MSTWSGSGCCTGFEAAWLLAEAFVVCEHFTLPDGFQPSQLRQLLQRAAERCSKEEQTAATRLLVPFLACGDLSGKASKPRPHRRVVSCISCPRIGMQAV